MALPMFGCPEADTGLPKTAMPPVPLNATTLPAPAVVPPMRLNDTPGSLGCAGPSGGPKPLELRKTMPCSRLAAGVTPSAPTPEKLPWMMFCWPPLSTSMPAPLKPTTLRAPAAVPPTVLRLPPLISMPNRLLPSAVPGAGAGSVRLPTLLLPSAAKPTKLPWMMLPLAGAASVPSTWMPSRELPEAILRSAGLVEPIWLFEAF